MIETYLLIWIGYLLEIYYWFLCYISMRNASTESKSLFRKEFFPIGYSSETHHHERKVKINRKKFLAGHGMWRSRLFSKHIELCLSTDISIRPYSFCAKLVSAYSVLTDSHRAVRFQWVRWNQFRISFVYLAASDGNSIHQIGLLAIIFYFAPHILFLFFKIITEKKRI